MSEKHLNMLLESNVLGAAHSHLDQAAQLLLNIEHPRAKLARSLADDLLDDATAYITPLAETLIDLPD